VNVVPADRRDLTDSEFHFSEQPELSEELRMLREQVRRFVEKEVVPYGEQWERDGKIPREIFRRMGELGFLGMRHPVEYGGTAMGALASLVFAEELGRSTFGGFTSSTLVHSDMSAIHITLRGTARQKEKYLPAIIRGETICSIAVTEPDAGSDVAGLKTRARREAIRSELPDALDLLAVSVEAGLGFDAAVAKLVDHMEGPLIDEFALTISEIRVGETRTTALRKMSERVDATELSNFVRAVVQAEQLGISLGRILRVQATDTRLRRQAAAEEKAMKAPIKMLFPTVFFIFPALFIVVLGPAFLNILSVFK